MVASRKSFLELHNRSPVPLGDRKGRKGHRGRILIRGALLDYRLGDLIQQVLREAAAAEAEA